MVAKQLPTPIPGPWEPDPGNQYGIQTCHDVDSNSVGPWNCDIYSYKADSGPSTCSDPLSSATATTMTKHYCCGSSGCADGAPANHCSNSMEPYYCLSNCISSTMTPPTAIPTPAPTAFPSMKPFTAYPTKPPTNSSPKTGISSSRTTTARDISIKNNHSKRY